MSEGRPAEQKRDPKADRALCEALPKPPWEWYGNTDMNYMYLSTVGQGRLYIMQFTRWGLQGGAPKFQDPPLTGLMRRADTFVQYEASHRKDFTGLDHPFPRWVVMAAEALPYWIEEAERQKARADAAERECLELEKDAREEIAEMRALDRRETDALERSLAQAERELDAEGERG